MTDDPFLAVLEAAPEDDEPLTAEDEAAIEEGWQDYLRGEASLWKEVRYRLSGTGGTERRAVG